MKPDLKHLRALCDAATDGDWTMTNTATLYAIRCNNRTSWNGIAHVNKKLNKPSEANARFIAATDPQTVRALIDEIEKLRGALKDINAHAQNQREGQSRTMHMVAIDRISKQALKGTEDE